MALTENNCYTNIQTKLKNCNLINAENIITKTLLKNKRDGTPIFKTELNMDFWKTIPKPSDIYLDEAHTILNSKRSMNKINIIIGEWLSMLRRILNDSTGKTGNLILITQRYMKLDNEARNLATLIQYHICHWIKECNDCHHWQQESSEESIEDYQDIPMQNICINCKSKNIFKHSHIVEIHRFKEENDFLNWELNKIDNNDISFAITNINEFFDLYNTLQWDNLFKGYY